MNADLVKERGLEQSCVPPLDGTEHAVIARHERGSSVRRIVEHHPARSRRPRHEKLTMSHETDEKPKPTSPPRPSPLPRPMRLPGITPRPGLSGARNPDTIVSSNYRINTMTDPQIVCPNCRTEIKLTESLAAPLLAEARKQFEQQLAPKEADFATARLHCGQTQDDTRQGARGDRRGGGDQS